MGELGNKRNYWALGLLLELIGLAIIVSDATKGLENISPVSILIFLVLLVAGRGISTYKEDKNRKEVLFRANLDLAIGVLMTAVVIAIILQFKSVKVGETLKISRVSKYTIISLFAFSSIVMLFNESGKDRG